ncbi:hypothetical protein PAXRUDRAFT_830057 [Paxillus rubicundulus Ve08.2h10]|uniref:Uncharacterized protein n=1 Tax=Paxillus rubicundulus Ve08.2h10 TaxID=930991 RepID=A0A0D0DZB1_9AGAM|nr:hypothetical protein PAXRUDRAFT_830057 [Paxillus rubicundulus Ve08.2h10]
MNDIFGFLLSFQFIYPLLVFNPVRSGTFIFTGVVTFTATISVLFFALTVRIPIIPPSGHTCPSLLPNSPRTSSQPRKLTTSMLRYNSTPWLLVHPIYHT